MILVDVQCKECGTTLITESSNLLLEITKSHYSFYQFIRLYKTF